LSLNGANMEYYTMRLNITVASGLTANTMYNMYSAASNTAYLQFDADF
jgi:hypothetical protein